MKLFINFFAAGVILVTHDHHLLAKHLVHRLSENYHIPSEFIDVQASKDPCQSTQKMYLWHLCVDKNGDLWQVSGDQNFIQQTLGVYL